MKLMLIDGIEKRKKQLNQENDSKQKTIAIKRIRIEFDKILTKSNH